MLFGAGCSKEVLDKSAKKPGDTFVVGFECGFRPHGFLEQKSGKYIGFDLDIAEEIARRRNWKYIPKPINWTYKDKYIAEGSVDCICNAFTIEGRENQYEWTIPYILGKQLVVIKEGTPVKSFADLANKVVAIQSTTPAERELIYGDFSELGHTFKLLKPFDDFHLMMKKLAEGKEFQIAICDSTAAIYWIKRFEAPLVVTDLTLHVLHDGIAVKRGNIKLRDQIEETLMEIVKDGTYDSLAIKWFGDTRISPFVK